MKHLGLLLSALVLTTGVCGPAHAQGPGSVAERYLFEAANAERTQRGLQALKWDDTLHKAAHEHAREMASRRSISHQYAGEPELAERGRLSGAHFSTIAENVAEAPSAARIHTAWMESPGHRENLLDSRLDAVAISVIERDGQLYAVQDFERSSRNLSLEEQETQVATLVSSVAPVNILPTTEDVRQTCSMDTGFAGARKPWFVMRFTAADLTMLPDALKTRLATGKYHQAAIGACELKQKQPFTAFNIAVLLYP